MPSPGTRIQLTDRIEVELRDGTIVRISPGPYGKGISVVPVLPRGARLPANPRNGVPHEPGKRGRKPRPSTVALRERLDSDSKAGKLREPPQYVRWLIDKDAGVGLPMARTVVYRELKKYR